MIEFKTIKMQFLEDEEFIHHEVQSDDSIELIPQQEIQKQKPQNIVSYQPIEAQINIQKNKPPQETKTGKKSYRDIFQRKVVEQLKKITEDNSDEDESNQNQYEQQPIISRDPRSQAQQRNTQQIDQRTQEQFRKQKYMKLMANHFATNPQFQTAMHQQNLKQDQEQQQQRQQQQRQQISQQPRQMSKVVPENQKNVYSGKESNDPFVINSVVRKRESRILQQELKKYEDYKNVSAQNEEQVFPQGREIEYVKAVPEGYTAEGERKRYHQENFHICNDKGSEEEEDQGVQGFLPNDQQVQRDLVGFGDDKLGEISQYHNELNDYEQQLYWERDQQKRQQFDDMTDNHWEKYDPMAQLELFEQDQLEDEMVRQRIPLSSKSVQMKGIQPQQQNVQIQGTTNQKNLTSGSRMMVNYPDGSKRPFGKGFKAPECVIKDPQMQQRYGREGSYQVGNEVRKGENTRSLYDDQGLSQLSNRYQQPQRAFKAFRQNMDSYEIRDKRYWIPIKKLEDIPQSFYMSKKYDAPVGLANADPTSIKTPYDAFRLFFNTDVYNLITQKTNSRLRQGHAIDLQAFVDGVNPSRPPMPNFIMNEYLLDGYFAAQIYQGFISIKRQQDYWERGPQKQRYMQNNGYQLPALNGYTNRINNYYEDTNPTEDDDNLMAGKMGHIMDKIVYDQIRTHLHVSDRSVKDSNDPLSKMREVLDSVNRNFRYHYNPEEFLVVDEGMIPFNGRVKFKVFNPDKPNQWGIKEYLLCDAVRAYTLEMRIYCGDEKTTTTQEEPNDRIMNRTQELVLSLLAPYKGLNHKVVMDNFYTSPQLFSKLKSMQIGAVGTIRHNRTNLNKSDLDDPHFQSIYPPQKEFISYLSIDNDNILVYFQGTNEKECALISSFIDISKNYQHKASIAKNHYRMTPYQTQPFMVYLYNKFRGGCDKRNSFVSVWRAKNRNQKWWRVVFDRLFQTAIANAAIIMRGLYPEKTTKLGWLKDFRRALMHEMIARYREYKLSLDPKKRERFGKSQQLYKTHTLVEGQIPVNCIECGGETQVMCQECSMLNDCIIGVCKDNEDACYRFHICAGNGWDISKAQDPLFSQAAQEFLQKKRRHRGRPSTWATIKQLREYKTQLEMENEKITLGTNEYDRAISLLNDTLGQLTKNDPNLEISQELSELLQELRVILPEDSNKKSEVLQEFRDEQERQQIVDLRKEEVVQREKQKQKIQNIKKQEEQDLDFCVDLGDLGQDQQKDKQISQIYNVQQRLQVEQVKLQQKQDQIESGPQKKIKLMGKTCQIVNF